MVGSTRLPAVLLRRGPSTGDAWRCSSRTSVCADGPSRPRRTTLVIIPPRGTKQRLQLLLSALEDGEGILALTGVPGTGKTLLCQCLLDRVGERYTCLSLTHTHFADRAGLLQALLFDLSQPHRGLSEQELRLGLIDHLAGLYAEGKRTLLVIDEAHHLSVDLLEELRLLGNLEGSDGCAVQIVLAGGPELLQTLAAPRLACLRQRLATRACIEPLPLEEAADYLLHHLRAAGAEAGTVIEAEALELIARCTAGVPRLLNQVTHQALRLAMQEGCASVELEVAMAALAVFGLAEADEAGEDSSACRLFVAPARTA